MSKKNGLFPDEGKQKVIEVMLESGVVVRVTPLPLNLNSLLEAEVQKQFPLPNEQEYEVVPENAAYEGAIIPAKDNPKYGEILRDVEAKRREWRINQLYDLCLEFPEGKEALIERFAPRIAQYRAIVSQGIPEDPWLATLHYSIMQHANDFNTILRGAQDMLSVTQAEVTDKVRLFRLNVSSS